MAPKSDTTETDPSAPAPTALANLYVTPPIVETLPQAGQESEAKTSTQKTVCQSMSLSCVCAIAVTAGSGYYLYHQFKDDIPKVKDLAQKILL